MNPRYLLVCLVLAVVLAGCVIGLEPGEVMDRGMFEPDVHVHNVWHTWHDNGSLEVHFALVNTAEESMRSIRPRVDLMLVDIQKEEGEIIEENSPDQLPSYKPGVIGQFEWKSNLTFHEPNPNRFWQYDVTVWPFDAKGIYFISACYRPDGMYQDQKSFWNAGECMPNYGVGAEDYIVTSEGKEYITPAHPRYQELVWECCELRSLPAYDGHEVYEAGWTGSLSVDRAFPVEVGAQDGLVKAWWGLPRPEENASSTGFVKLRVVDENGTLVAEQETLPSARENVVRLENITSHGIYRAYLEAEGMPNATVHLEFHVNDGVHPPQKWWED